jgi:hypothetical protein
MESLESRLCRLSPEQQKEVEDFIDFLLQRQGERTESPPTPAAAAQPAAAIAPPPLTAQEPAREIPSAGINDLIRGQTAPVVQQNVDPATLLIQEIASEKEDILTADYMDYGKFEPAPAPPPSPATEAVQRVKIRLSGKKARDPANNVLEWIE